MIKFSVLNVLTLILFSFSTHSTDFNYYSKIWRHRSGSPENTPSGMIDSYQKGFRGFEIDLFYYKDRLIVSHDKPNDNAKYLSLQEFLSNINIEDQNINVWLDLKNLSFFNCNEISRILKKVLLKKKIIDSTFVESKKSILGLNCLRKNGIHGVFWVQPSRFNFLSGLKYRLIDSLVKYFNIHGISFDERLLTESFLSYFSSKNIHLFTINDQKRIEKLTKDQRIKSILTDQSNPSDLDD